MPSKELIYLNVNAEEVAELLDQLKAEGRDANFVDWTTGKVYVSVYCNSYEEDLV